MGLRSLGNPLASFLDVFSETVSEKTTTTTAAQLNVFGGNVVGRIVGDWTYHTFTSPGTLTLQNTSVAKDAEFLLVGGGGSGGVANNNGSDGGGGGGAGNVNTYEGFTTAALGDGDFTITVGTGAGPFPGPPSPGSTVQAPQVGGDTTVIKVGPNGSITAKGGGGGAHGPVGGPLGPYGTGGSGGGGGGGGGANPAHWGPAVTNTPQPLLSGISGIAITQRGNPGGHGNTPPYYGGGGGGAGGAGTPGSQNPPRGRGGAAVQITGYDGASIGVPALSPYNGYYGGGGPGGAGGPGTQPGNDAPVNGSTPGSPASNGPLQGGSAVANTGGGGGGASGNTHPPGAASPSGAGGPGIVVFRYRH